MAGEPEWFPVWATVRILAGFFGERAALAEKPAANRQRPPADLPAFPPRR